MLIDKYQGFVSEGDLEYIKKMGAALSGRTCNMVNLSAYGGVNEILEICIPIIKDFGFQVINTQLKMPPEFLALSKKMYEGLSNAFFDITQEDIENFFAYAPEIIKQSDVECDLLYVHDHQPIAAVGGTRHKKSIWRCHTDISHADALVWNALKTSIEKYDAAAFSFPSFAGQINIPRFSIMPSVDPLSDKNKELDPAYIKSVFAKYKIPQDKPVLLQVGRFDATKDPLGVIEVFREVKQEIDCSLVLLGWKVEDDKNYSTDYQKVLEVSAQTPGVYVLPLNNSPLEVNALQRGADVVIQKSIRESFGLSITEALWKKKAVVASETGGIPLQIIEGHTGLFCVSNASCVAQVKRLLKDEKLRISLGEGGHNHVKENFLITRHIRDLFIMFCCVFDVNVD